MMIVPRSKRIVTPGSEGSRVMLQLKMAWADREEVSEGVKLRMNALLLSTPVRGVLSMLPVMVVGRDLLFAGFSYNAMIA